MARGRPFEIGNTAGKGRVPGSRNKRTVFQTALETDAKSIIGKIKDQALNADPAAMRLCIERLVPVAKPAPRPFFLPPVETPQQLKEATSALLHRVSEGVISPREGESVARIIESQRKNIEVGEFDARLKALEEGPSEFADD